MGAIRSPKHGLTQHVRGGWYKSVNGRTKFICGKREAPTPEAADDYYQEHFKTLWEPPVAPVADPQDLTIDDLCNVYLTRQRAKVGRSVKGIDQGTYDECKSLLDEFCHFHLDGRGCEFGALTYRQAGPDDFAAYHAALDVRYGYDRFKKSIIAVRSVFKRAAKRPLRLPIPDYEDVFGLPSKKDERRARKRTKELHGVKEFEPWEIRDQICGRWRTPKELAAAEAERAGGSRRGLRHAAHQVVPGANLPMKLMILMGINAGFGNTDVGEFPVTEARRVLRTEWFDYDRGKTGTARMAWAWPETRKLMRRWLRVRPAPAAPEFAHLLFLTPAGLPYVTDTKDHVAHRYGKILDRLGQNVIEDRQRKGRGYYSLRRTYRGWAFEVGKELVIDLSMGHAGDADDMAKVYTVRELKAELMKVANHVRSKLFPTG